MDSFLDHYQQKNKKKELSPTNFLIGQTYIYLYAIEYWDECQKSKTWYWGLFWFLRSSTLKTGSRFILETWKFSRKVSHVFELPKFYRMYVWETPICGSVGHENNDSIWVGLAIYTMSTSSKNSEVA